MMLRLEALWYWAVWRGEGKGNIDLLFGIFGNLIKHVRLI